MNTLYISLIDLGALVQLIDFQARDISRSDRFPYSILPSSCHAWDSHACKMKPHGHLLGTCQNARKKGYGGSAEKSKQQIWLFCASKDCTINMQMIQTFLVYGGITLSLELTLKEFQEVEEEEGLEDTQPLTPYSGYKERKQYVRQNSMDLQMRSKPKDPDDVTS